MPDLQSPVSSYDPEGSVNLKGFTGSLIIYGAGVVGLVRLGRATGFELPERFSWQDLTLGAVATHKLSRLLTKSSIASPLRAPFTEFEGASGSGEHVESPRGEHGVRHTVGELLTCPFCAGVWIATAYVAGLLAVPRVARLCAAVLTLVAASDALQQGYERLRAD